MHAHVSCARILPSVVFRTRHDISVLFVDSHGPTREMPDHFAISSCLALAVFLLDAWVTGLNEYLTCQWTLIQIEGRD